MSLIVDVGLHHGQDTAYYLHQGARVVAIEADPELVQAARVRLGDAIAAARLFLVHAAVGLTRGTVDFHRSDRREWSSLTLGIATRRGLTQTTISVPALRLPDIFDQYGTPDYCKIDIEGADLMCLRTLEERATRPRFISVESECAGDSGLDEDEALETLQALHSLGYKRFKLVDQATLSVLDAGKRLYGTGAWERIARSLSGQKDERTILNNRLDWSFELGASGPYGDDLDGEWSEHADAVALLRGHRRDYFSQRRASPFGFWCDWHASL